MLRRRKKIEDEIIHAGHCPDGQPRGNRIRNPTARKAERIMIRQQKNEERIRAVEQAWCECQDDWEKEFIKQNLFEHQPMQYINLPISERTMKRYRKKNSLFGWHKIFMRFRKDGTFSRKKGLK